MHRHSHIPGVRTALALAVSAFACTPAARAAPGDALAPSFTIDTVGYFETRTTLVHDAAGNFLVVYQVDGRPLPIIKGQLFSAAGVARGAPFTVVVNGMLPTAAMNAAGDFVISWMMPQGASDHLYTQRYSAAGAAIGAPIDLNTRSNVYDDAVAMDGSGDFALTWSQEWQIELPDGLPYGGLSLGASSVRAQRYSHDGSALGARMLVDLSLTNPTPISGNFNPPQVAVAADAAGDLVFAWTDPFLPGRQAVRAHRYNANGTAAGLVLRVSPLAQSTVQYPSVAMDGDGDFAVGWTVPHSNGTVLHPSSSGYDLYTQRFTRAGKASGSAVHVSQDVVIEAPALAMDSAGNFAFAWIGTPSFCCVPRSLRLQAYGSTGTALGGNVALSADTDSGLGPLGLTTSAGNLVLVWDNNGALQGQLLAGP